MDWATISALATAFGTFVLALATFASVRSANRSARLAEQSLLVTLRPLLVPTRFDDPSQKVHFADDKWFKVPGGAAAAEAGDEAVYFVIPLRNVGTGIGVLHGWKFHPDRLAGVNEHAPLEEFHRLSRDLYISPNDVGFWQGALRDPSAEEFAAAREVLAERRWFAIELLYGDIEGTQRTITRYALSPRDDGQWFPAVTRHWNIDRPGPR